MRVGRSGLEECCCSIVAAVDLTIALVIVLLIALHAVMLLLPVIALLFDLLLWQRQFGPVVVLGIALVVAPSAWLMLRSPLRRQSAAVHTTG